ncbi:hypothetical protein MNBD_NITROSPINAE02-997 [hydrothermal vent metagenome]|uniref:Heavy metal RND efflux outer membrane protein, CzcC family n=1 Tax=hydrothermal vent metagenome TaxID=652676 RepID=A0A3B1CF26_9ZZZZ
MRILPRSFFILALTLMPVMAQGCLSGGGDARYVNLSRMEEMESPSPPREINTSNAGEPRFDGNRRLDLKTVIELALKNNPSLLAISEKVKEAVNRYPLVTALDDPMVGVGLYPSTLGSNGSDFAYKINFQQRIPYPGKLGLKGDYALAEAQAVFKDLASARLELIRMVEAAYLELYYEYSADEITEEEKRLLMEFKTIASARYAAGKGNLQNVIHADLDLAKVEHKQIVIERERKIATARLNVLLGRGAELALPAPSGLQPVAPLPEKGALMEKAKLFNPCIVAARSRMEAAQVSLKLAKSKSYPDFMVTGSYNTAWMNKDLHPFIGVGINIPIVSDRLRAENKIATAKIKQATWKLQAATDKVRFDVERAWQRIKELHHARELFRKTLLPETKLNLNAALAGYSEGKNDFLTLITAQRALVETKLKYERILVDMRIWDSRLTQTIGEKL